MATPKIDMSAAGCQRRTAEIDRRMNASSATGSARAAERRRVEAAVEQEEAANAQLATARVAADAERARIASVVTVGIDLGKGRQALRLALIGPVSPAQAVSILPNLSGDHEVEEAALAVPGFTAFPGEPAAAAAERRRLGAIFAHPAAAGRFRSARALALDGDAGMPVESAVAMLASLPLDRPRIPGPGERAAADNLPEFGADFHGNQTRAESASAGWRKAAEAANRSIGAGSAPAPGQSGQVR